MGKGNMLFPKLGADVTHQQKVRGLASRGVDRSNTAACSCDGLLSAASWDACCLLAMTLFKH
jgi:hypothetical protein